MLVSRVLGIAAICLGLLSAVGTAEVPVRFESDVRSILKAHCFHCHGEEEKLEGKLDLRLVRTITQGGESGPGLVAGKPRESLILKRVISGEMPPKGKQLSSLEVDTDNHPDFFVTFQAPAAHEKAQGADSALGRGACADAIYIGLI